MGHRLPHFEVDGVPLSTLNAEFDHPHTPWFDNKVHEGAVYQVHHGENLPNTLFWNFIEFRSDLDPPRFAYWHPHLGHMLWEWRHRPHEVVSLPHIIPPVETVGLPPTPPIVQPTGTSPEPSSLGMMLVALTVVGAWIRRKKIGG